MAWLALLALMLIVSAAPGVLFYLEYLRADAAEHPDHMGDGPRRTA